MTSSGLYRKREPVEAMQWTGRNAEELWEWTARTKALGNAWPTVFMVLSEDDAYETFRCYDEDYEIEPDNEVDQRQAKGFTAVIYDHEGRWANLKTGDWVVRVEGFADFAAVDGDEFARNFVEAAGCEWCAPQHRLHTSEHASEAGRG